MTPEQLNAIDMIAAERQRQIEKEGFDFRHDDEHRNNELVKAAVCYAMVHVMSGVADFEDILQIPKNDVGQEVWPWDAKWWKPSRDGISNLIKAGALIVAEIERLQRQACHQPEA